MLSCKSYGKQERDESSGSNSEDTSSSSASCTDKSFRSSTIDTPQFSPVTSVSSSEVQDEQEISTITLSEVESLEPCGLAGNIVIYNNYTRILRDYGYPYHEDKV